MNTSTVSTKALVLAALLALAGCGEVASRTDFETQVKGLSTKEVESKLGKPAAVDTSQAGTERWTYKKKTFSVDGKGDTKFDNNTIVVFKKFDPNSPASEVDVVYE